MKKNIRINNRMRILDLKTGEILSLKKFKKNNTSEISMKYLSITDIIKRKILTKTELQKLTVSKVLKEIRIKNKRYINKTELFGVLSKK